MKCYGFDLKLTEFTTYHLLPSDIQCDRKVMVNFQSHLFQNVMILEP